MHGVDRFIEAYPDGIPTYMQMILIRVIEQLSLFKILVEETILCIITPTLSKNIVGSFSQHFSKKFPNWVLIDRMVLHCQRFLRKLWGTVLPPVPIVPASNFTLSYRTPNLLRSRSGNLPLPQAPLRASTVYISKY